MSQITIWDLPQPPPEPDKNTGQFIFWRSFENHGFPKAISLPRLVERNALALRKRYLAWVYQAGQTNFRGKKIVDYFEIYPGFNYWWMTYLVEKCNYDRSIFIEDIIRLLALVSWIKKNPVRTAKLYTLNLILADCFRKWCLDQKIDLDVQLVSTKYSIVGYAKKKLLKPILFVWGGYWLILKYIKARPLRNLGKKEWINAPKGITFASYFFNYDARKAKKGNFQSHFWGSLPSVLKKRKVFSRWIHLWGPFDEEAQFKKIACLIKKINLKQKNFQAITVLESFLEKKFLAQCLKDYIKVAWKSWILSKKKIIPKMEGLEIWPFFAKQWEMGSLGSAAMSNLYSFHLFKQAFQKNLSSPLVYLMENQPWELGMIQAWRKRQKGSVVGFPHSTVRFWDLRYFFDERTNLDTGKSNSPPKPDMVAVHSKQAHKALSDASYPPQSLIRVEALRFQNGKRIEPKKNAKKKIILQKSKKLKLGLFTDFNKNLSEFQLFMLSQVSDKTLNRFQIFIKSHPANQIEINNYQKLKINNKKISARQLLVQCDLVFTSNSTSVAFEAYSLGIPVITAVNPERFNYSPFFNQNKVTFVRSPKELENALQKVAKMWVSPTNRKAKKISSKLLLWEMLLSKCLKLSEDPEKSSKKLIRK